MININTYVDKIFFINMDKDTERLNALLEQFKKHNITNYERVSGMVVSDTEGYELMGPFDNKCDPEKYKIGSIGCLLTHKKIIEMAKTRGYKK